MKHLKRLIHVAVLTFAYISYASASSPVAFGAFDGNTVTVGNQTGSTVFVVPDCSIQVVYSNFGNYVFTIFCDGSPAPRILIAYNSSSQSCTTINIIDPTYAVPECGINLWRVTRNN